MINGLLLETMGDQLAVPVVEDKRREAPAMTTLPPIERASETKSSRGSKNATEGKTGIGSEGTLFLPLRGRLRPTEGERKRRRR